jgi:hypothetical protein
VAPADEIVITFAIAQAAVVAVAFRAATEIALIYALIWS